MSTIKVDTVKNRSSAINLPNNFKIGGLSIIQGYTSSGSEPGSPSTGDFWWDSSNDKLYRYIDGGFKELSTASASNPWSGDRALASGRAVSGHYNEIQRFDITTAGNSVDFGDLINNTTTYFSSTGSSARGLFVGGYDSGLSGRTNVIQYVTPSSPGNAQDFGDLSLARQPRGATSNGTRAVFSGGLHGGGYFTNTIDYITVASAGNATDFGDTVIAEPARGTQGTVGDATRGLFANAAGNSDRNIDYFTYASPGNATDFGDLVLYGGMVAGCSDATRTVFSGGRDGGNADNTNQMCYVTTQTAANAVDFGNLTWSSQYAIAGVANATRGVSFGGAVGGSATTNMDFYTIQTAANAADFADLVNALAVAVGTSGAAA
tara:strand:+ start:2205 stop:3335 length:1131 start_codon:yes stop_codon:yes gene_type:complete